MFLSVPNASALREPRGTRDTTAFVPHIHVAVRVGERDLLVTQSDLDEEIARRAAPAYADHAELMRSNAMRRLAQAVGGAALAPAERVRFDIVLDRSA